MPAGLHPQFINVGELGQIRRIAALVAPGAAPGLIWLPGFKSDMTSIKATALADWAAARGLASTRFDYSGHGQSGGDFNDGRIGMWLADTEAVFTRLTDGPQVVIGSSMGGYIALLLLRRLLEANPAQAARIKGLILIAPAWDMTEELMWTKFTDDAKAALHDHGVWLRPSAYGEPYAITSGLIEEGRHHLLARKPWNPGRPVSIIHGLLDPDVPWQHTNDLVAFLDGGWAEVTTVPDGEHRLSRPQDLDLMFSVIERVLSER